jgi:hypothetical protein
LIFFVFRDDTYFPSSIFICFAIIGRFAAGVRILLEKASSSYHSSEDENTTRFLAKFIFFQMTEGARRRT